MHGRVAMIWADLQQILTLFGGYILAVANAVYTWWIGRQKDHKAEIEGLRAALTEAERERREAGTATELRIAKLENDMRHLPDKELVTDIRLALAKLEGTVGQFGEKLTGVAHIVGVIDESLRNKAK